MDDDDDDESVVLDFEKESGNSDSDLVLNPDDEYDGQCGYGCYKLFRGRTSGRKMKRELLRIGIWELCCGLSLTVITSKAVGNFDFTQFVLSSSYGASLQILMWTVGISGLVWGFLTMVMLKYWASLVTNRDFLGNLLRIYMVSAAGELGIVLWTTSSLFLVFKGIDWKSVVGQSIQPYFAWSVVFLLPYAMAIVMHSLNISYYNDEIVLDGIIAEPNPPDDVTDLSDLSIHQLFIFACALPCVLLIQCMDCCNGMKKAAYRFYEFHRRSKGPGEEKGEETKKKKKATLYRIQKAVRKFFKRIGDWWNRAPPVAVAPDPNDQIERRLKDLRRQKEKEEEQERQRAEAERERQAAEKEEEQHRREAERAADEARQKKAERERKEAEEKAAKEQEDKMKREKQEREKAESSPTLSVQQYKALWSSLGTAGSFQCKLKAAPTLGPFTEHLRKQGFHVVFAVNPNATDIEVGICNIRESGVGDWFLARFLASQTNFSAVMKCQNSEDVSAFVRRFALAKVLKIDTSK